MHSIDAPWDRGVAKTVACARLRPVGLRPEGGTTSASTTATVTMDERPPVRLLFIIRFLLDLVVAFRMIIFFSSSSCWLGIKCTGSTIKWYWKQNQGIPSMKVSRSKNTKNILQLYCY